MRSIQVQDRIIKLPSGASDILRKVKTYMVEHQDLYGEPPSIEQCAAHAGIAPNTLRDYMHSAQDAVSLDAKARTQNEDGSSILDLIAAENEKPEDDLILTTKVQAVQQALSYMCENSKMILSMRYGLDGEEPCSKREIARRIGIAQDTTARLLVNAERQLRLILKEGPPGKYQPQKHSSSLIWGWG